MERQTETEQHAVASIGQYSLVTCSFLSTLIREPTMDPERRPM
jgi:hypothetical protein